MCESANENIDNLTDLDTLWFDRKVGWQQSRHVGSAGG